MTQYTGFMVVKNSWTVPFQSGQVVHYTSDWPSSTIKLAGLAPGKTSDPVAITTSTTNTDHWQYTFSDGSGFTWQNTKNCAFDSEDNKGTVIIDINANSMEFIINMPKSSDCSQGLAGYAGSMKVTNRLWAPISGSVSHYTTDYGTTTIPLTNLGVGESTTIYAIATGPSNTDHWKYSIQMVTGDGSLYSMDKHDCAYWKEDHPKTVEILFKGQDKNSSDWYMNMPSSSDCSSSMSFTDSPMILEDEFVEAKEKTR